MLQLHGAIYRRDSFVLILYYRANLKAIRYESTSLNKIVTNKSHRSGQLRHGDFFKGSKINTALV